MSDRVIGAVPLCAEGLHDLSPSDPLDPTGTSCQCGYISLIGTMTGSLGGRRVILRYLLDTSDADPETDDPDVASATLGYLPH